MPETELTAQAIIEKLNLQPLPGEGGLYTQSYLSAEVILPSALPARYASQEKPYGTAIYFLLTSDPDSFSALHCLPTDEIYHFYLGDPVEMTLLHPDGRVQRVILGPRLLEGQQVQFVVPGGVWQGSRLAKGGDFGLLGTTMAPGFTPSDYIEGRREELLAQYPQACENILALTRLK